MAHAFVLDGTEHEIWLARAENHYCLHLNGQRLPVHLTPCGGHAYELIVQDERSPVFIAQRGDDIHVHLDGETHSLRYVHGLSRFAAERKDEGEAVARAPMPGSVIAVSVEPGQQVQRGQALIVIESMKMETTINAAFDGIVRSLHANVGQTFDRDAVLVTLERIATE